MFASIAAAALAAAPAETVSRPDLPGFVVGHQQSAGGASILEQVPDGETVHKWTRMVTTQRFENLAGRVTGSQFLGMLAQGALGSCPGATASDIRDEGAASIVRLDCPSNPTTGLPETFIAKAEMGSSDLHVFQVAWRLVPTAQDIAWGEAYLKQVKLKR